MIPRIVLVVALCSMYADAQMSAAMNKFLPSEFRNMPQMPKMPDLVKQMIEAPKKKAQAQLARRKAYEARMARYRQLLLRADRSKNPYNQRAANSIISPANAVRRPNAVHGLLHAHHADAHELQEPNGHDNVYDEHHGAQVRGHRHLRHVLPQRNYVRGRRADEELHGQHAEIHQTNDALYGEHHVMTSFVLVIS